MNKIKKAFVLDWQLYLLCLPAFLLLLVFDYFPMYGVQIAFKNYDVTKGIWGSDWVGLDYFIRFFNSYQFDIVIKNTVGINLYYLIVGFPIPILLALLLSHTNNKYYKKLVQTVSFAPYFISTVVLAGMIVLFLSPSTGVVNNILLSLGLIDEAVFFMGTPSMFWSIFVGSSIWSYSGFNAIVYLAAISGIDPQLYEAAKIDGASIWQLILHIDLPGISHTIVIMFIMAVGSLMSMGFQKAYLLQNDVNLQMSEVISTYVYKLGLLQAQYSYASAIGLFNTAINIVLIFCANKFAKRISGSALW